jgi:serine/threonine-protein kinase
MLFPSPPPPGDLFTVPDLYSADFEEARRRIEEAGLVLGVVDPFRHPSVDSGRVVGQDPLPGQLASPASPVRVSVSLGAERRLVPDVSLLRSERAREVLEATGFTVRIDSVRSSEPRGRVTSLSPAAGTQLSVPGEVQLYVSIGPSQIVLPTLVGMDEAEAREIITALGLLLVRTEEDRPGMEPGRVLEQDPPTQELLEPGSVVRIVVGRRGAVPDTIPGS